MLMDFPRAGNATTVLSTMGHAEFHICHFCPPRFGHAGRIFATEAISAVESDENNTQGMVEFSRYMIITSTQLEMLTLPTPFFQE